MQCDRGDAPVADYPHHAGCRLRAQARGGLSATHSLRARLVAALAL
jgi:hypothetical protein